MTESRIPTGRTRSVGLFTIIAEELNSELSDQGGTWIRATGCESSAPTARPSCLPQGVGEEEKKERGLRERKGFPFPLPFFSPPPLPPFLPMPRRLQLPIFVWYCPPNDFFVTFIQDWVYKQICCCTTPLHPLVAPLLEAFVHSVINPVSSKSSKHKETAFTLHGFTDAEVMSVFAPDQQVCVYIFYVMTGLDNLLE